MRGDKQLTVAGAKGAAGIGRWIDRVRSSQPLEENPEIQPEMDGAKNGTYLIVGLGNPGNDYTKNRHNIGFMLLDRLAEILGVRFGRIRSQALFAEGRYRARRIILAKPQTFMNASGQAVVALQRYYRIPLENMMVAFDEMDLPLGLIRIRPKGGSSGHNGMKSIIRRLGGSQAFPRIRLGIGRPPGHMPPADYLLQDFSKEDQDAVLPGFLEEAARAVLTFIEDGVDQAMNKHNGEFSGDV